MIIAFSVSSADPDGIIDGRFGRAQGFMLYDSADDSIRYVDNVQNLNAAQGAGIQAAQTVLKEGAECLVTGHCGPKAFRVLHESQTDVYLQMQGKKIREVAALVVNGQLQAAKNADVEGHWV